MGYIGSHLIHLILLQLYNWILGPTKVFEFSYLKSSQLARHCQNIQDTAKITWGTLDIANLDLHQKMNDFSKFSENTVSRFSVNLGLVI